MEVPETTETYSSHVVKTNWGSSGTYYVEAPEQKNFKKWACYACLLLLVLLIFALFVIGIVYGRVSEYEKKNKLFMEEFRTRCSVIGNWTEEEISPYRKYFLSYKGKNITNVCNGYQCFTDNQKTIEKYNNQTEKGISHFGNTVFSDWCGKDRQSYVQPIRSATIIKAYINNNKAHHYSQNSGIAQKIVFNDSLPFNETVKSALLQWMYYANTSQATRSVYPSWEAFAKNASKEYELYDIMKPTRLVEEDDFHKSYLIQEGVFATEVYLNDLVFFYQDGVLPRKVCDATYYSVVKFPVIVLGYGFDGKQATPYWEVQPIGAQFKQFGKNGTMKIHDTCYKKNNAPRIIDIDLKSRQESSANEEGLPIGKFATLPFS